MVIEDTHKQNFEIIEKYKIKVGQIWMHKENQVQFKIMNIHPDYGWITSVLVKQNYVGTNYNILKNPENYVLVSEKDVVEIEPKRNLNTENIEQPKNTLEAIEQLETFFQEDLLYAIKNEKDLNDYIKAHFNILKNQHKLLQQSFYQDYGILIR